MFQPISFNVIRQALTWHGFPVPTLRLLSSAVFEDSPVIVAEYRAEWRYAQFDELKDGALYNGWQALHYIEQNLQECFCSDVQVRELRADEDLLMYVALFYVQVDKGMINWLRQTIEVNA